LSQQGKRWIPEAKITKSMGLEALRERIGYRENSEVITTAENLIEMPLFKSRVKRCSLYFTIGSYR
jgi:hypothetical protein